MASPLQQKLENGAELTDEDRSVLERLVSRQREVAAHTTLIAEGERPEVVRLVMKGMACRYKLLGDGRRQIMALLVPGDFCDLHIAILGAMDHAIATITPCTIVEIPRASIDMLGSDHDRITRALWWATLVDEALLREWIVNLGQRRAAPRMAHLMCELLVRLQTVGEAQGASYDWPFTQEDLADLLGLSIVHVNRTLQTLRKAGLIILKGKQLVIADVASLKAFSGFDPNYLHLKPAASNALAA